METRKLSLLAVLCLVAATATGCAAGDDEALDEGDDEGAVDDSESGETAEALKTAQLACDHFVKVSSGYLNVRTGPGTNYPRARDAGGLIKLYNGHQVPLLSAKRTNGFFPVQGPTGKFWIAGKYVREVCEI